LGLVTAVLSLAASFRQVGEGLDVVNTGRPTMRDLEATAAGMDPKLRPLFLEQVARLRDFVEARTASRRPAGRNSLSSPTAKDGLRRMRAGRRS
jgi:hypothetical protein